MFEGGFQARQADLFIGRVAFRPILVYRVFGDMAHISDQMGSEAAARIIADGIELQDNPRQVDSILSHQESGRLVDVFGHFDGPIRAAQATRLDRFLDFFARHIPRLTIRNLQGGGDRFGSYYVSRAPGRR